MRLRADPVRGGDSTVRSARVRGGSAANVAAMDAELGGSPRFVGQVGDDHVGRTLADDLRRRGVDVQVTHAGGTGLIVTMIGRGGRSRLVDRGASRRVSRLDPAALGGSEHLYIAANALTDDPFATAIDRLLGEAADRRIPVTIGGTSIADLESIGRDAFLALCRTLRPGHVVLNRAEHSSLGLAPHEAVEGAAVTVVTNGRRPTLLIEGGTARSTEVPPVEKIVDRTGVGDGFVAGFLRSRRTGADPAAAAQAGHRIAARVLSSLGPTVEGST